MIGEPYIYNIGSKETKGGIVDAMMNAIAFSVK